MGLPDLDGFEVCRRLRRDSPFVVMLTERRSEEDVLRGYELGVDDYVTKPVRSRILAARVGTVLRRTAEQRRRERDTYIRAGGLELDVPQVEVHMDSRPIHLSPLEFRILYLLTVNHGRIVPYERLIEYAWSHDGGSPVPCRRSASTLSAGKLDNAAPGTVDISAVTGTGYRLMSARSVGRPSTSLPEPSTGRSLPRLRRDHARRSDRILAPARELLRVGRADQESGSAIAE